MPRYLTLLSARSEGRPGKAIVQEAFLNASKAGLNTGLSRPDENCLVANTSSRMSLSSIQACHCSAGVCTRHISRISNPGEGANGSSMAYTVHSGQLTFASRFVFAAAAITSRLATVQTGPGDVDYRSLLGLDYVITLAQAHGASVPMHLRTVLGGLHLTHADQYLVQLGKRTITPHGM
jgi:hypothetical protein